MEESPEGSAGQADFARVSHVHGEQLLAEIARQSNLGRSSLKHVKVFLSGVFKQAKRFGILDGTNPMMDVSIPLVPEPSETYAYSLEEVRKRLLRLNEPVKTVVLTMALSGLRKSELWGLEWQDFNGRELSVNRSVWNGQATEPKTARSRAPVPVVKMLADALEALRQRMGKLAVGPIFQAGNGKPLNLDNVARQAITPALKKAGVAWHGWHAFRRGLGTNLHRLGVEDKTIQAILRHSNIGLTMNVYVKSMAESQINAMDAVGSALQDGICNENATPDLVN
ncbi:MAG TPA: site-specific integrase [Candidatus Acidoferrales bacterium]|nr:site-specific integrase [Candidatus Acidoferrales bacterium]